MLISVFPTLDAAAVTNDLSTLRQCVPFAGVERRRAIRRAAPAWCAPRRAAPAARRGGPVADLILNCANLTAILERHIFYAFVTSFLNRRLFWSVCFGSTAYSFLM